MKPTANRISIIREYFISIDYARLFLIISDYFRLFYYRNPNDYTWLSQKSIISLIALRLFHLFFTAYIIAIIAIIHDYVHNFYPILLYVLFYFRELLRLFFQEPSMCIMRIVSQLFELYVCLTILTISNYGDEIIRIMCIINIIAIIYVYRSTYIKVVHGFRFRV